MSGMGPSTSLELETFRRTAGPLVDVRSPSEFQQGHWPGAINLPLFSDDQRAAVGLTYKTVGREEAIQLGLEAVGPRLASLATQLRQVAAAAHDSASGAAVRIYCWRGGMRSGSVAWLAQLIGLSPALLAGGYKTYRRWVLQQFTRPWPLHLLGGRTGTGKTDLLLSLQRHGVAVVDLEGLAHHRGSSFGGLGQPEQPSTEHYENLLAEQLDHHRARGAAQIWLEAESAQVGRCRIPQALFQQMRDAPVLEIQRSLEERIAQLVEVYAPLGAAPLQAATERISRRLGPQRTKQALDAIQAADWATACRAMLDYYDRCYDHELARAVKRREVDLQGLDLEQSTQLLLEQGLLDWSV